MPINPSIALQTQIPTGRSPISTLGALSQLRDHQEMVASHRLQNEQRQRDLEDDDAIREATSRLGNPDAAIEELSRTRPTAANTLSTQVYDWRKKKTDEMKARQEVAAQSFKMLTQIANTVTDQKTLDMAVPAARALLMPVFDHDEQTVNSMLSQLGTEYDPDKIKQVRAWGTSTETLLAQQKDAREAAEKAIEIGRNMIKDGVDRDKARIEADKYWTQAASGFLSTAKSQEQWDAFQRTLVLGGAPPATLARFGNQYSPEAAANAKTLGMSPKDVEDVKHQGAEERNATANLNLRQKEFDARETTGGPASRPLTPNRKSEIEEQKHKAYLKLEDDLRTQFTNAATGTLEIPEEAKGDVASRKLAIENGYRSELGMPSLEQSELQFAADPSKKKDLAEIRFKYRKVTGTETPLAQMEKIQAQIKSEKDPTKRAALNQQLLTLRTSYRDQMGR